MNFVKSTLFAFLLMGTSVFAQTTEPVITEELVAVYSNGSAEEIAKSQTEQMNSYLNLTEAQYSNVYELNLHVANKIQAIQNNSSMTDDRKKIFIEGNLNDRRNAMSQILNEEQFKLFDQNEYQ